MPKQGYENVIGISNNSTWKDKHISSIHILNQRENSIYTILSRLDPILNPDLNLNLRQKFMLLLCKLHSVCYDFIEL